MSRYATLDALILKRCAASPVTFNVLRYNDEIEEAACDVAKPDRWGRREPFRVVDRRLQALRKAGLLIYSRSEGWRSAPRGASISTAPGGAEGAE